MMNRSSTRSSSSHILMAAVVALVSTTTPTTQAFVHPLARPVGGHCASTTASRSQAAAAMPQVVRTNVAMSASQSSSERGVTRADAIRRVGSAVLKGGGGAVAGVVLGGALGADGLAAFAQDEEAEQFEVLKNGLDLKKKEEQLKENLPLLTNAANGLKTLNGFIEQKDYSAIRQAMRAPPISNLRTSSKKVISNLSDEGVKAKSQEAYKALIASVEELDRVANDGVKGSLKDDKGIMAAYDKCVKTGETLLSFMPTPI